MWAPVARPEIIRDRLATYPDFAGYETRGFFDYMGTRVCREYIDEIGSLEPLTWAQSYDKPIFFAQAEGDTVVKPDQVKAYLEIRKNRGDRLLLVDGGDHFFGAATNLDQLIVTSTDWLVTILKP